MDSINNMNDLIEKADQGTQAESLGVGTQDEGILIGDGVINGARREDGEVVVNNDINNESNNNINNRNKYS